MKNVSDTSKRLAVVALGRYLAHSRQAVLDRSTFDFFPILGLHILYPAPYFPGWPRSPANLQPSFKARKSAVFNCQILYGSANVQCKNYFGKDCAGRQILTKTGESLDSG
jgi:hypothetical protein